MRAVLLVTIAVLVVGAAGHAQTIVAHGCAQMSNGNIVISPYIGPLPTMPPTADTFPRSPKRVTLSADLDDGTLLCRETDAGSDCKTIGALFPRK